jgi:hypothetical protein
MDGSLPSCTSLLSLKKIKSYFLILINNSSTIKKGQWIKISKLKKLIDLYVVGFELIKDG